MNNRDQEYLNQFLGDVRNEMVEEARVFANKRFARAEPRRGTFEAVWELKLGHPLLNESYREIRDTLIKSVPMTGLAYMIGSLTETFVSEFVAEAERARERIQKSHPQSSLEHELGLQETFSQHAPLIVTGLSTIPQMVREGLEAVAEEVIKDKISSRLGGDVVNKLVRPVANAFRAVGSVGAQLLIDNKRTSNMSTSVIGYATERLNELLQEAFVTVYVKELVTEKWEYVRVLSDILIKHPTQRVAIAEAFLRLPVPVCAEWLPALLKQLGFSQKNVEDAEWLVLRFRKGWGSLSVRLLHPVSGAHKTRMNMIVEKLVGILFEPRYYFRLDNLPQLARQTLCNINTTAGLQSVRGCRQ
ncbi:hypothetical protein [Pleomorphovibrio marinus]|uniref:hypothetical protein n=1 Tax=Pleomorphovibrio marinus TaxID=2164132 RepID=UPI000E0A7DE5|nr:hypothetical protein [Pleomorphovibrio marinus]